MRTNNIYLASEDLYKYNDKSLVSGRNTLSLTLLKDLLSDKYFDALKKCFKDENPYISIKINDSFEYATFTVSSLARAFEELLLYEDIDEKTFDRILSLRELSSFEAFYDKYKDKSFYIDIDNLEYKIRYRDIFDFLLKEEDNYKLLLKSVNLYGIKKEHFLYAIDYIFNSKELKEKYLLPSFINNRLISINKCKDVDIYAINRLNETNDTWNRHIRVNKGFKDYIMNSIPKSLNELEKSIYLYILLCKTLTYDPVFFAYEQREKTNHSDWSYVEKVNREHNKVVCYELNSLYGYFLNELGINYEATNSNMENYSVHASLTYRVGKFLINADSVESILAGDLVRSKINYRLNGLNCLNTNADTKKEFETELNYVYSLFTKGNRLEDEIKVVKENEEFKSLSVYEKMIYMLKRVAVSKLEPIDSAGLLLRLRKELLTDEEKDKLSIIYMRYKVDEELPVRAVITIKGENGYEYYIHKPSQGIVPIDSDKLDRLVISNNLEYLEHSIDRIPGLSDFDEIGEKYKGYSKYLDLHRLLNIKKGE